MSGLVKAKKYDWKDSNLAMFGSDTEKEVKKEAAESEPAWKCAGKKPGLQIWRINQFKVETWPTTRYGHFFTGDSYIILNTYKDKESDKLLYDVHFWIGKHSTQDEYGTAAYKTVELDTLLDDVPVQHREVQDHESELFRSYFKTIIYNEGGAPTGFKHVEKKKDPPRLYRVTFQGSKVKAFQVKVARSQVKSDDCFVLDDGDDFYQFIGSTSNCMERYKARCVIDEQLKPCRPDSQVIVVEEEEGGEVLENFYVALEKADAAIDDDDDDELQQQMDVEQQRTNRSRPVRLIRVSDAGGELTLKEEKEGHITKRDFKSEDVFILDSPTHGIFVWNGRKSSRNEKKNGMCYAQRYLQEKPYFMDPITVLEEGKENSDFRAALAA